MAAPTLVSTTALTPTHANTATWAPSLGFTASTGDLLVIAVAKDDTAGGASHTYSGSWVRIYDSGTIGGFNMSVAYLVAAGGETAVDTITDVNSDRWAGIVWRFTGAGVPTLTATNGSSTTPDPPNHAPVAGSNDYYWIAGTAVDTSAGRTFSDDPDNYTNVVESVGGGTSEAQIRGGSRAATAASENPTTFTLSGTETWTAFTISVPPGGGPVAYTQTLTGGLTSAGALKEAVTWKRAGALTPAGAHKKAVAATKTGAVTFAGAHAKLAAVKRAGAVTLAGAHAKLVTVKRAGALTTAGAHVKAVTVVRAGAVTFSGALTSLRGKLQSLAGTLTMAGAHVKAVTGKRAGALTLAGAHVKAVTVVRTGAVTLAGAHRKAVAAVRTGAVTLAGALANVLTPGEGGPVAYLQSLAGTLTLTGLHRKAVTRHLAGTVTFAGQMCWKTAHLLGTVAAGTLTLTAKIVGSLTPTAKTAGTLTITDKTVGTLTPDTESEGDLVLVGKNIEGCED